MRISDWSSDVCSSDLTAHVGKADIVEQDHHDVRAGGLRAGRLLRRAGRRRQYPHRQRGGGAARTGQARKSVVSGKSVSVRVDLGGRRIIKKKNHTTTTTLTQ